MKSVHAEYVAITPVLPQSRRRIDNIETTARWARLPHGKGSKLCGLSRGAYYPFFKMGDKSPIRFVGLRLSPTSKKRVILVDVDSVERFLARHAQGGKA